MIKLALIGPSRPAKSRVAEYLKKKNGFKLIRLDDVVKEVCRKIWGWEKASAVSLTVQFQLYDAIYNIDKEAIVRATDRRIFDVQASKDVVIPDARYINEIEHLQEIGFKIIRVSRTDTKDFPRYEFIKKANPGLISITEWLPGTTAKIKADYSIIDFFEKREQTLREVDKILEMERAINV